MSRRFHITLSPEGIALALADTPEDTLYAFALDPDTLPDQMEALRAKADEVAPEGWDTVLILPDDQILYTRLTMPDTPDQHALIKEGLDGLTPYAVSDLVFDWERADEFSVQVAAVAQETLAEAEAFADGFQLRPMGFAAAPERARFPRDPWFGPTQLALSSPAPIEGEDFAAEVEDDLIPVAVNLDIAEDTVSTGVEELAEQEDAADSNAPAEDDTPGEEETPVEDAAPIEEDAPAKNVAPVEDVTALEDTADLQEDAPAEAEPTPDDDLTSETPSEEDAPVDGPDLDVSENLQGAPLEDATEDPAPEAPTEPELDAATEDDAPEAEAPIVTRPTISPTIKAPKVVPLDAPSTPLPSVPVAEGDAPKALPANEGAKHDLRQIGIACAALVAISAAFWAYLAFTTPEVDTSDFATLPDPVVEAAVQPEPEPDPTLPDLPAPSIQAEVTALPESTVHGADVTLPAFDNGLQTPSLLATPPIPESAELFAGPRAVNITPPEPTPFPESVEPQPVETAEAAPAPEVSAEDATVALDPIAIAPAFDAFPTGSISPDAALTAPTPSEATAQPAETSTVETALEPTDPAPVETAEPDAPGQAPDGAFETAALAPESAPEPEPTPIEDPVEATEAKPTVDPALAEPEEVFDIQIIEGAPENAPAIRPAPEPEVNPLAELRPVARPDTILPRPELRVVIATEDTPGYRPALRPEALAVPRPTVIIGSAPIRPTARPRSQSASINDAVRAATAPATTSPAPSAPEPSSNPGIPTSASIADRATEERAIRLRQNNLIGISGTTTERRAIVRSSSGRIRTLVVGDRFDGGRVSAITNDSMVYVKNGKNVVMKLPNG